MKKPVAQNKTEQSGTKANALSVSKSTEQRFQFKDNRPETAALKQLKKISSDHSSSVSAPPVQRMENKTGLPDNLKSGVESLSGISMDDVKVHYNSSQPAQLNAHAYAQGTDIHVAPGQEKHLAHEAWHVVQQKQGRVQPTMQLKGKVNVNDDMGLEKEADLMGAKAMQMKSYSAVSTSKSVTGNTVQRSVASDLEAADNYNNNTHQYENYVFKKISNYKDKIQSLDEQGKENHAAITADMAQGLKTWSQNYYNKTQAYLYEGQKADDHTNLARNPSTFAILGSDTDLNADIEVHKEHFNEFTGESKGFTGGTAVELKASTSENYEAVYKLVRAGLDQLKKRELQKNKYNGKFELLKLVVHNDDPKNYYPFTDFMMETQYGNNANNVNIFEWSARLRNVVSDYVRDLDFKSPVEILLEHNGQRYATANFGV